MAFSSVRRSFDDALSQVGYKGQLVPDLLPDKGAVSLVSSETEISERNPSKQFKIDMEPTVYVPLFADDTGQVVTSSGALNAFVDALDRWTREEDKRSEELRLLLRRAKRRKS